MARDVLDSPGMYKFTIRILLPFLISLSGGVWPVLAQSETFTGEASVKGAGGANASAPLTVVVRQYATDAERDELVAALKNGSTAGRDVLAKRKDAGSLQLASRQTAIKYAYARTTPAGRLITVVTAEPIVFLGASLPDAKSKAGYDMGLVMLEVPTSGSGHGELVPATKVRVDDQGAIVTDEYGGETVHLANVVRK